MYAFAVLKISRSARILDQWLLKTCTADQVGSEPSGCSGRGRDVRIKPWDLLLRIRPRTLGALGEAGSSLS